MIGLALGIIGAFVALWLMGIAAGSSSPLSRSRWRRSWTARHGSLTGSVGRSPDCGAPPAPENLPPRPRPPVARRAGFFLPTAPGFFGQCAQVRPSAAKRPPRHGLVMGLVILAERAPAPAPDTQTRRHAVSARVWACLRAGGRGRARAGAGRERLENFQIRLYGAVGPRFLAWKSQRPVTRTIRAPEILGRALFVHECHRSQANQLNQLTILGAGHRSPHPRKKRFSGVPVTRTQLRPSYIYRRELYTPIRVCTKALPYSPKGIFLTRTHTYNSNYVTRGINLLKLLANSPLQLCKGVVTAVTEKIA